MAPSYEDKLSRITPRDRPRTDNPDPIQSYIDEFLRDKSLREQVEPTAQPKTTATRYAGLKHAFASLQDIAGFASQPTQEDIQVALVRARLREWRDYDECRANSKPSPSLDVADRVADELYEFQRFSFDLSSKGRSLPTDADIRARLRVAGEEERETSLPSYMKIINSIKSNKPREDLSYPERIESRVDVWEAEVKRQRRRAELTPEVDPLIMINPPKPKSDRFLSKLEKPKEIFSYLEQFDIEAGRRERARNDELAAFIARTEAEAERQRKEKELRDEGIGMETDERRRAREFLNLILILTTPEKLSKYFPSRKRNPLDF